MAWSGSTIDDDDDSRDDPAEWDRESDEDQELVETVRCRNCHRQVVEDAEQCPSCGYYITSEDESKPVRSQPTWVYVTAIVILIAFAMAMIF